jgi:hypothetical protein
MEYHRQAHVSTCQTKIARLEATTFGSKRGEFSQLGYKSLRLRMTRANDRECKADLIFFLHLV